MSAQRKVAQNFVLNPKQSQGIKFVLGILQKGKRRVSEVQSVLFDKAQWAVADAKKWLKDNGFKVPTVDDAKNFFRFRQRPPSRYKEMRTIEAGSRENPVGSYHHGLSDLQRVQQRSESDGYRHKGPYPPSFTVISKAFRNMLKDWAVGGSLGPMTFQDRENYKQVYFQGYRLGAHRTQKNVSNPESIPDSLSGHLALTSSPFFQKQTPEIQAAMMTGMDLAEAVKQNPTPDWPSEWRSKVDTLLRDWHEAGREEFQRHYPNLDYDQDSAKLVSYKQRWAMLDQKTGPGRSGAFMLDRESGNIYRIKSAYGVPNYNKLVGHISTVTGQDLYRRRWNPEGNPIGDLGSQAFDAAKQFRLSGAYYDTGVANARVAGYGFSKWYNKHTKQELKGYRKETLRRNWMEGWAAGKRVERRNPDQADAAAALSEEFHGRPAESVTTVTDEIEERTDLTELGNLIELKVATLSNYDVTLRFAENGAGVVKLASSPDGRQLYFVGGDQSVPLDEIHMGADKWKRDQMILGVLYEVTYRTEKGFDHFKLLDYYHRLGEVTKQQPMLEYDTLNDQLSVAGGQYHITARGIEN